MKYKGYDIKPFPTPAGNHGYGVYQANEYMSCWAITVRALKHNIDAWEAEGGREAYYKKYWNNELPPPKGNTLARFA